MAPRRPRRKQASRRQIPSKNILKDLHGGSVRTSNNPPPILLQPYYPMTIQHTVELPSSGLLQFRVQDIVDSVQNQLGLSEDSMRIKIQSLRVWNLDSKELAVEFREMIPDSGSTPTLPGNSVVFSKVDYGSPITYPSVGYRWPQSMRDIPHTAGDPPTTSATLLGDAKDRLLLRICVLWAVVSVSVIPPRRNFATTSSNDLYIPPGDPSQDLLEEMMETSL